MGDPAVFTLSLSKFVGIGIIVDTYNGVPAVSFGVPFLWFRIVFKKFP